MRTHTCPPDHKHGLTSTCYVVHLCGCRACMDGNARRRRDRYRLLAYGRYQDAHQPIEPIRQHLQALVDTGMIPERIAISAGVGFGYTQPPTSRPSAAKRSRIALGM